MPAERLTLHQRLGHRAGITAVGLGLAALGGYLLAAGRERPGDRVVDPAALVEAPLVGAVAAVMAALLTVLAIRWLVSALADARLGARSPVGIAMLGVALKGIEGIARLHVRMVPNRRIRISVSLRPGADVAAVVSRLEESAVSRTRSAVGAPPDLPALVRVHVRRR